MQDTVKKPRRPAVWKGVIGGILGGGLFVVLGKAIPGIALLGASIFCTGLSIFFFYDCKALTKATARLTKKVVLGIKNGFVKKEANYE